MIRDQLAFISAPVNEVRRVPPAPVGLMLQMSSPPSAVGAVNTIRSDPRAASGSAPASTAASSAAGAWPRERARRRPPGPGKRGRDREDEEAAVRPGETPQGGDLVDGLGECDAWRGRTWDVLGPWSR